MNLNKNQKLIFFLILPLLWTSLLHLVGSPHHTFAEKWRDNVSNISSAYLFSKVGFDIYRNPLEGITTPIPPDEAIPPFPGSLRNQDFYKYKNSQPLFFVWPNVARPYPLGAWVVYGPFSALFYLNLLNLEWATLLLALFLYIAAHFCFYLFLNFFSESIPESPSRSIRALKYFTLFFFYYELMRWTGQGQYDVVALIFMILSMKEIMRGHYSKSLLYFGLTLSFHFRGLLLLGPILLIIGKMMALPRTEDNSLWNLQKLPIHLISAILGLVAAYIFYLNLTYLSNPDLYTINKYHYLKISDLPIHKLLFFVIGTTCPILYFGFKRKWELLAATLSLNFMFCYSPQVRGWYVIFIFPIFMLLDKKSHSFKGDLLVTTLAYIFVASSYPSQSPFEFTFFRELYQLIF